MLLERTALVIGFLAGDIAIGAFLGRSHAAFARQLEIEAQVETAVGGIVGLVLGLGFVVIAHVTE